MTHFNWSIDYLKKYSSLGEHSNIVLFSRIYLCRYNTAGTISMEFSTSGNLDLNTENLVDPVAYVDLTEDVVLGWLSEIKTTVETKVEGQINGNDETIIKTMPWH